MTAKQCFEFLLSERKRQNEKIDFTVEYCRLLCMIYFKSDYDEKVFNEFANNKKDKTVLFKIDDEKDIVFKGKAELTTELCKYERDESEFFVDQFCEADAVMQLHAKIYIDGVKSSIVKALEILELKNRRDFYAIVKVIGKQYEINGHIVERVLIE